MKTLRARLLRCLLLPLLVAPASRGVAQALTATCGAQPSALKSTAPNIFSDQQEQWLGDAMADMLESSYRPVRDPAESAYLQGIADRLLAVLPPTQIRFRLLLVDAPEINGLSLAGGRVYITRKLVATAKSEDEVASVIAHEFGHILSHQIAIETTASMKRLMGVTQVGDRADVYAKFLRLMDMEEHDTHTGNPDSDEKQDQADRIAVYATAAAGYRPAAYAEFWDRSFFVGGKTSNRFKDFFGATKPTEKRLRLIRAMIAALPAGCGAGKQPDTAAFQRWHDMVLANQKADAAVEADASALKSQVVLEPSLRLSTDRLRFSPDGKYVLAQDESSIFVLTRDPFAVVFRIDADRADEAHFAPDSQSITFSTSGLHVERWRIADQKLAEVHEVNVQTPCIDSTLSPDGRTIVCVFWNELGRSLELRLIDVETNGILYDKKEWFHPSFLAALTLNIQQEWGVNSRLLPRTFSADGNSLLIGPTDDKLAFDLRTRAPVKVSGGLQSEVGNTYAFMGSSAVAGVNDRKYANSGTYSFPDGKVIKRMDLRFTSVDSTTSEKYLLVYNLKDFVGAVADMERGTVVTGSKTGAMDVWDSTLVGEGLDGSLRLAKLTPTVVQPAGVLTLPTSMLGRSQSAVASPDGRYLAFSGRARGAIWDLTTGKQTFLLKGFRGGTWTASGNFLAAYLDDDPKTAHLLEISPATRAVKKMDYPLDKKTVVISGMPMDWKVEGKIATLTAYKRLDHTVLWTKKFAGNIPPWTTSIGGRDLIFALHLGGPAANEALHAAQGNLLAQASAVRHKENGWLVQIVSTEDGAVKQQVVIEAPVTFSDPDQLNYLGDHLYLSVDDNRTVVYSFATGQQTTQTFGSLVAADPKSGRVAMANRRGELTVYSNSGDELAHIRAGERIRFADLLHDGTELLVLTADQKVHRYDVSASKQETASASVH